MNDITGLEAMVQGKIISPVHAAAPPARRYPAGPRQADRDDRGDPKETMPGFVIDRMAEAKHLLGSYPMVRGSDDLRRAIGTWIERRYGLAGQDRPDCARSTRSTARAKASSTPSCRRPAESASVGQTRRADAEPVLSCLLWAPPSAVNAETRVPRRDRCNRPPA